jgi:N-glycosylase/DNA lyase
MQRISLALPQPFELSLVLQGHGWIALPPHRYDGGDSPWQVPLRLGSTVALAAVRQRGRTLQVALRSRRPLGAGHLDAARAQLRHMLRLDEDLAPFWRACRSHPAFAWVARRGGGRLLRSASVFEDLMKLLLTTNCTWSLTTAMTRNLVAAAGAAGPDGSRAFPTPAECDLGERFFRDEVRVGYRARACAELAAKYCQGEIDDAQFVDPGLPTAELRRRLLLLHGFGPYAAGQALRLLGHYDDLALDSWCRSTLAQQLGRRRPPSDRAIASRFAGFGPFAGLALWCSLTAPWHGEQSASAAGQPA